MGGPKHGGKTAPAQSKAAPVGPLQAGSVPWPPAQPAATQEKGSEKARRTNLYSQLHKTKFCLYHLKGACQFGSSCSFAHTATELQVTPDLRKTRLCASFADGIECVDPSCPFAHGEVELRSTDMFYKKTLCIWNEKGKCRNGDQCRFAHGMVQLQSNPNPGLSHAMVMKDTQASKGKPTTAMKARQVSGSTGASKSSTGGYAISDCSSFGGSSLDEGCAQRNGSVRKESVNSSPGGSQDLHGCEGCSSSGGGSSFGSSFGGEVNMQTAQPMKVRPTRSLLKSETAGTAWLPWPVGLGFAPDAMKLAAQNPHLDVTWHLRTRKLMRNSFSPPPRANEVRYDADIQAELNRLRSNISDLAARCTEINAKMQTEALVAHQNQAHQNQINALSEALAMGMPYNEHPTRVRGHAVQFHQDRQCQAAASAAAVDALLLNARTGVAP
ncbi:unnamed protein product, partial [Polarella glacialis]